MKRKISILASIVLTVLFCIVATSCMSGGSGSGSYKFACYITPDASPEYTTVYDDDTEFYIDDLQRFGYTFLGLYDSPSGGAQIVNEQGYINVKVDRDMTLYAQWRPNPCQIVFNANGGTNSTPSMSATYGSPLGFLPIPEKTGFDFLGWADKNGKLCTDGNGRLPEGKGALTNDVFTFEDGIVNLTAVYETKKLTVTLDYNDGSYVTETITLDYATVLDLTQLPQKDTGERLLASWSTSPMAEYEYTSPITENITLYAIWKDYKNFEFYETGDETPTQVIKIFRGETITPYTPERGGYEFDGWYIQPYFSGIPVNTITYGSGSTKYYAKWNTKTYTVDFAVDGEYIGNTDSIEYNIETDVLLPTVTKENYTFLGWCKNQDLSDTPLNVLESGTYGDLTLYAKFKGDDRQITLDAGEGYVKQNTVTVEYGAINTLPVPVISGMVFVGWALEDGTMLTDREGVLLDRYLMDGTVALTAQYKQKYFITVDVTHPAGKIETKEYYVEGDNVILKFEQTNFGYNFDGFFKDGELVSVAATYGFVMPAENIELTVELTPKEFLLTFNLNGAFETAFEQTVTYGETYTLPVVYKQGYIFEGWLLDGELITDSNGKSLNPCSLTENATVMASFKEDTKNTITYIKTSEDFKKMYDSPKGTYVLLNDIDISNITYPSVTFTGVLEGNGYSITGISSPLFNNIEGNGKVSNLILSVHVTATDDSRFGAVARRLFDNAEVKNIIVTGKISIMTDCDLGGVVGNTNDNSTVVGCENRATIIGNGGSRYHALGGIVGWMVSTSSVTDCKNYGAISGKKYTGGIVGGIAYDAKCKNCENYGAITGVSYTGGIIGHTENAYSCNKDMFNAGEIIGKEYTGGIVGCVDAGAFETTYTGIENHGNVTGTKYTGGLFGYFKGYSDWGYNSLTDTFTAKNLTNEGNISGTSYVGGLFGYMEVSVSSKYTGWLMFVAEGLSNIGDISGTSYVGGLFGYAYSDNGESNISNSYSGANISADSYVGGLAGKLDNIRLLDSSNEGTTVTLSGYLIDGSNFYAYAGGYVGYAYHLSGLENSIPITYDQKGSYIGGIAGYATGYIFDCKNFADINASKSSCVGGIIGMANYGAGGVKVQNNLNSGNITGADYTGGIIGQFKNYDSIGYMDGTYFIEMNDLDNSGDVTGEKYVGGIIGHFHANIESKYTGWSQLVAIKLKNTGDVNATSYAGGLFGYAYSDNGDSNISESSSSAKISADYYIGGLAGELSSIKLIDSSNEGTTIVATGYLIDGTNNLAYIGGYVGIGQYVNGCHNSTEIIYNEKGRYVGGIIGYIRGSIENCSNDANITAEEASYVGGIAGYAGYASGGCTIKKLTNLGNVRGASYVGGIFGAINAYASVGYSNSTSTTTMTEIDNKGSVRGTNYVGGICGHINLNIESKYTGWMRIIGTKITSSGDVIAESVAGGLFGYFKSDGSSEISDFSFQGTVSATDGTASDTVWEKSNLSFTD